MEGKLADPNIERYTTEELKQEILRREEENKIKIEEEKKLNSVRIVCPLCEGTRVLKSRDWHSGIEVNNDCYLCLGNGSTLARRF